MTKEQLREYRDIKLERDKLKDLLDELEGSIYSFKSPRMDGMPGGNSQPGNPVESAAIKHQDLLARYEAKATALDEALAEIERAIDVLPPRERTLIRLYYAQGLTWEEVCVAMNYSWRQIHRIHSGALKALKMSEEERHAQNTTETPK